MSLRTAMSLPEIDQGIAAAQAAQAKWTRIAAKLAAARHAQLQAGGVWNRDAKSLQRAQAMAAHHGQELQLLAGIRTAWLNSEP